MINRAIPTKYAVLTVTLVALFSLVSVGKAASSFFSEGIVIGGTTLTSGLLLEVNGKIGAAEVCDEAGANCTLAADLYNVVSGGGGSIDGTGTVGYISRFVDSDTVESSIIRESGSNIGIDVAPAERLHVFGNLRTDTRSIYFSDTATGGHQLYGNNGAYLYFDSADANEGQILLRDAENTVYGGLGMNAAELRNGLINNSGDWILDSVTGVSVNAYADGNLVMTVNNAGDLLVGTTTSQAMLTTDGDAYFEDLTTLNNSLVVGNDNRTCNSTNSGLVKYTGEFLYCDGSTWVEIGIE